MKYAVTALLLLLFAAQTFSQSHTSPIDVLVYKAELSFDIGKQTIDARAEVTLRNTLRSPIEEFCLDLRDMHVSRISVEGSPIQFNQDDSVLTIMLPEALPSLDTQSVCIEYAGHPTSDCSGFGTGVSFGEHSISAKPQSSTAWYVSLTCHWLPVNNIFSDRAIYDLTFDVPVGWVAASMGTLVEEEHDDERARYRWLLRDPIHPHVAGWSIGQYFRYETEVEGHQLVCYSRKGFHLNAEHYFQRIGDMISTFEQLWGPYPGEKIGFAITDSASIETHTMILLEESELKNQATANLEAHELAHHWWGNCVTPMDLRENWLSEGFAMYGELLYTAQSLLSGQFDELMASYATLYAERIAPTESYAPLYAYREKGAPYNYSSVIYIKGAVVLNMLRQFMGDSLYHAGLREYFRRYRYKNVTSTMFRDVMQEFAGEYLEQFFQQWVYEIGWPIFDVCQVQGAADDPFKLRVRQLQTERGWGLFETPVDLEIVTHGGGTLRVRRCIHLQSEDILLVNDVTNAEVASWRFDPDGWLLKQMADPTPVQRPSGLPHGIRIDACYPQPACASDDQLTVQIATHKAAYVDAELCDMLGRQLRYQSYGVVDAGEHSFPVGISEFPSGNYLLRMHVGEEMEARIITIR
jgi:aminopeptidase N